MTRIAVIANPGSRRNRARPAAVREVAAAHPELLYAEAAAPQEQGEILAEFARRGAELLAISGGDGTVQSVLTALCNGGAYPELPRLAVLPAGMTNLIARDVGVGGRPDEALLRLIGKAREQPADRLEGRVRSILSVRHAADRAPAWGMFLGGAGFYHGTMLGRAKVHPLGAQQGLAAGLALLLYLLRLLRSARPPAAGVHGDRMELRLDGVSEGERAYSLLLATTLERRLMLGLWPFWGEEEGAIRFTTVAHPPARFARALLPLMRGRPRPWMIASGYRSRRLDGFEVATDCPLVLDGEILPVDRRMPVAVAAGRRAVFLTC